MSVNPGFGGQSFIESQVKKISELRRLCAEKVVRILPFASLIMFLDALLVDFPHYLTHYLNNFLYRE